MSTYDDQREGPFIHNEDRLTGQAAAEAVETEAVAASASVELDAAEQEELHETFSQLGLVAAADAADETPTPAADAGAGGGGGDPGGWEVEAAGGETAGDEVPEAVPADDE